MPQRSIACWLKSSRAPSSHSRTSLLAGAVLAAAILAAARLEGQGSRDSLIAQATKEFDTRGRVRLLVAALNPSLGPPQGAWSTGVQLLAETLIEDGQDSLAGVWLRWAIRRAPDLQPDTVQLLPKVIDAFRAARLAVGSTQTDTTVRIQWAWPSGPLVERRGRMAVLSPHLASQLGVEVRGVGAVEPSGVSLEPATYQVVIAAPGYDSVRVALELLPGVTTIIAPDLRASTSVMPRPVQPAPSTAKPAASHQKGGKGFPWIAAVLGAGAAGGVVAFVASRHKNDGPSTGAIIITFNP